MVSNNGNINDINDHRLQILFVIATINLTRNVSKNNASKIDFYHLKGMQLIIDINFLFSSTNK